MSAGEAVRVALVGRLGERAELVGVALFAGEPANGVLPRVEVAEPQSIDWSAKGMRGRELRTAVTVRVAEGQSARLDALAEAVEQAGESLEGEIDGWRVAGAVFLRTRAVAEKGMRVVLIEHRMRVVRN